MKKFFLLLSAFCFFAAVQAQTPAATTAPSTTTKATTTKATTATPADKEVAKPVEHVCTAACKQADCTISRAQIDDLPPLGDIRKTAEEHGID